MDYTVMHVANHFQNKILENILTTSYLVAAV